MHYTAVSGVVYNLNLSTTLAQITNVQGVQENGQLPEFLSLKKIVFRERIQKILAHNFTPNLTPHTPLVAICSKVMLIS